ncbi:MAG: hypothetical protein U0324_15975 [Polyangiales bacterium]
MRTVVFTAAAALLLAAGCAPAAPPASCPLPPPGASPSPLAWLALGVFASVATALGRRGGDA